MTGSRHFLGCASLLARMGRLLLPGRALRKLLNGAINSCPVWPRQSLAWVPSSLCPRQLLASTGGRRGLGLKPDIMHTRWLWARYAPHLLWEARQPLHVVPSPTCFLQETEWCELGCGHTTSASLCPCWKLRGCHSLSLT